MHFGGDHRGRGVGTHAAGVRAGVLVADALVVLAGGHGQHVLAVDHDDEAGFLAVEELLDHHAGARIAEGVAGQHVTHGGFGFFQGHGDDHALARGQAVGLDHDRRAFFLQVGQRRLDFGEVLVVGGRDLVTRQEVLGEGLGAFQLGRALGRAEAVQAAAAEQVDHADDQRCFRADDGQVDVLLREVSQLLQGAHIDGDVLALGFNGGAGVARGNEDFLDAWVLGDFPGQGVLTAAAADDQNFHVKTSNSVWPIPLLLWERPCVAKGPQSGPGNLCCEAENLGPLRAPFATQGRSHRQGRGSAGHLFSGGSGAYR
ncbi:hypothetical protein D3C78_869310 [compost metagenome]